MRSATLPLIAEEHVDDALSRGDAARDQGPVLKHLISLLRREQRPDQRVRIDRLTRGTRDSRPSTRHTGARLRPGRSLPRVDDAGQQPDEIPRQRRPPPPLEQAWTKAKGRSAPRRCRCRCRCRCILTSAPEGRFRPRRARQDHPKRSCLGIVIHQRTSSPASRAAPRIGQEGSEQLVVQGWRHLGKNMRMGTPARDSAGRSPSTITTWSPSF